MGDKLFEIVRKNVTKPFALIAGFVLLLFAIFQLDSFLTSYISNSTVRIAIYLFLLLIWLIFWVLYRRYLPRTTKGYLGLITGILTENDKQKVRIKNDLVRNIQELSKEQGLDSKLKVILLNQHQSQRVINSARDGVDNKNKSWIKIRKRIRGHFYILGDIKERQDGENKYFLNLEGVVLHSTLQPELKKRIGKEFNDVWAKKIDFLERLEFKGFEISAELIFVAVLYITGLAAFYSRDPFLAFDLHKKCEKEMERIGQLPPNLQKIQKKLNIHLADESVFKARYNLNSGGDLQKTKEFLDNSFEYDPNNYGAFLVQAIIEFAYNSNPEEALKATLKASKYAGKDGTWRYSQAFLLMYMEKFPEAIKVYKKISEYKYATEQDTLQQVYSFNTELLEREPDKIQSLFILGYLKYKKEDNFPQALSYFEQFIEKSVGKDKYEYLVTRASSYIEKLKKHMNIR